MVEDVEKQFNFDIYFLSFTNPVKDNLEFFTVNYSNI